MNIMFDSMSTQVQVQNETSNRLTALLDALENQGATCSFTDPSQDITPQLDDTDVLVILTHYLAVQPGYPPAISPDTDFAFSDFDLSTTTGIPSWVNNGGQLLLVSNHTFYTTYDSTLAQAFGITIVPASFQVPQTPFASLTPAVMVNTGALDWQLDNVEAYFSCGIAPGNGTALYTFPPGTIDGTGQYDPSQYAFAVSFGYGDSDGTVLVAGRSGLAGDAGTGYPAPGEVANGSNLSFLLNCINWLGGTIS